MSAFPSLPSSLPPFPPERNLIHLRVPASLGSFPADALVRPPSRAPAPSERRKSALHSNCIVPFLLASSVDRSLIGLGRSNGSRRPIYLPAISADRGPSSPTALSRSPSSPPSSFKNRTILKSNQRGAWNGTKPPIPPARDLLALNTFL